MYFYAQPASNIFFTVVTTGGVAATSGVSGWITKDSGSQAFLTVQPAHVANGQWRVSASATEMTATSVGLLLSGAGLVPVSMCIPTVRIDAFSASVASAVWNYTFGTRQVSAITLNVTGYTLIDGSISEDTFTAGTTFNAELSSAVVTELASSVWSAASRTLTDYVTGSIVAGTWAYGTRVLTDLGSIAAATWGYATRTLTDYASGANAVAVWNYGTRTLTAGTGLSMAEVGSAVWNYTTGTRIASAYILDKTGFAPTFTEIGSAVWNSTPRTLTSYGNDPSSAQVASAIWYFGVRTLTDYATGSIVSNVWANATRTLTDYLSAQLVRGVWTYGGRLASAQVLDKTGFSLTAGSSAQIASAVWNLGTRTLTTYGNNLSSAQAASAIWYFGARTLTDYASTVLAAAIWNYTAGTRIASTYVLDKTGFSLATAPPTLAQIVSSIWAESLPGSYTSAMAGYKLDAAGTAGDPWTTALPGAYTTGSAGYVLSNLASSVWVQPSRTLTSAAGLTFAEVGSAVWNYTTGTRIASAYVLDKTGFAPTFTDISSSVWNATTRNLTDYATGALVTNIWGAGTRSLTNYGNNLSSAQAASAIWYFGLRTLTDYASTIIASSVWNYGTRTITSGGGLSFAEVGSAVWNYVTGTRIASAYILDKTGFSLSTAPPTLAQIVSGVWSESLPGSYTSSMAGYKLDAAGTAGDPWSTTLPGAYTAGSAGYALSNVGSSIWYYGARTITSGGGLSFSEVGSAVWNSGTRTLTDYVSGIIADAVWDEARSGHTNSGSFGEGVASVQGNVTGTVQAVVSGSLTVAERQSIASAVLAATVETGWTTKQALMATWAVLAGTCVVSGTTVDFYDPTGTKKRVSAEVNPAGTGDRYTVTYDLT